MADSIEQPKVAVLFGGDGYIGRNLILRLAQNRLFDHLIVADINKSEASEVFYEKHNIQHIKCDVRHPINQIPIVDFDPVNSWIFNFAAIHREPGHDFREYFDTNVPGAKNVVEFAEKIGVKNIFFTSSIAPYGRSEDQRTENSSLYPETAYGISKALAEEIHQKWLATDKSKRLIIVRPSVIFGPNDPGNVYRMISSLKKGTFILPNGGNIVKAYGYVYGLIDSILFTIKKQERLILYNYAESALEPLNKMVKIAKEELEINKPVLKLPVPLLVLIAFCVQVMFRIIGKKTDIHPVRVKKAGFPTNIKSEYLQANGFEFRYDFRSALRHWKGVSPEDFQ
ncbi:NAD(P)-dependent oxidoreductase [Muricauda oceani]|uniref:NAD(P)-dependent oxidoreductase n=1 Tax=Flagellimonas oceani TaxID=2698672 RepID=A0A6G7J7J0_9FLAO|nr:NAD(P)-dependent oxidoreductase [Allomuricauda oceani]MBW8242647.1 NAD(P)-dependent oxidoreductase [Allomuricauda oceani]QII46402.1 NAD(P)-dependent oxidoreductase [Allomuricauda oceani]